MDSDKTTGPILIVDESLEILHLMETVLQEYGFTVQTATSNEEALEKARLALPSLVLLDVGLSRTPDEVFVAALHEMSGHAIPLIVVSAVGEPAFERAVRRTGAIAAIRKPFDLSDLLVGVQRALNAFGDPRRSQDAAFRHQPSTYRLASAPSIGNSTRPALP